MHTITQWSNKKMALTSISNANALSFAKFAQAYFCQDVHNIGRWCRDVDSFEHQIGRRRAEGARSRAVVTEVGLSQKSLSFAAYVICGRERSADRQTDRQTDIEGERERKREREGGGEGEGEGGSEGERGREGVRGRGRGREGERERERERERESGRERERDTDTHNYCITGGLLLGMPYCTRV